jgi:hypothetical protein
LRINLGHYSFGFRGFYGIDVLHIDCSHFKVNFWEIKFGD